MYPMATIINEDGELSKNVLLRETKKSFSELLLQKYLTLEADHVKSVDKVKLNIYLKRFYFLLRSFVLLSR